MAFAGLATLQSSLLDFILDKESSIEQYIVDSDQISAATRLGIYHNAYRLRLRETIETDHPVLGAYLGDEWFDQMVDGYVARQPSCHTSLRQYADALPDFLSRVKPFCDVEILAEIARFERLLLTAFDAADCVRFTSAQLQQLPQENWPSMTFRFHASFQIFYSQWNTVDVWQSIKSKVTPSEATSISSTWWIWRNDDRLTQFRSADDEEVRLVSLALRGASMEALCDSLLRHYDEHTASQRMLHHLTQWIDQGLLSNTAEFSS
jgi:Putative DNA-binding domain